MNLEVKNIKQKFDTAPNLHRWRRKLPVARLVNSLVLIERAVNLEKNYLIYIFHRFAKIYV